MTREQKEARRKELYGLLGDLPPLSAKISSRTVAVEERDGYILEKLVLDLNGLERVPAYFVKPAAAAGPLPAVLYHHAHGGRYEIGKEELITGRASLQPIPYAKALTANGYCALCFDTWAFGERAGKTETEIYFEMLWSGRVMFGMMLYDSLRAVDYLMSRPDVDSGRIGAMGLSMGSTMTWWHAALDPRIRACVDICCMTDFQALIETRGVALHGPYYFVPGLLKHFTTAQINALIAPRPHLSLAGIYDRLTPPHGLERVDREVSQAYAEEGAADAWCMLKYECGHMETAEMRCEILAFLQKWL